MTVECWMTVECGMTGVWSDWSVGCLWRVE